MGQTLFLQGIKT